MNPEEEDGLLRSVAIRNAAAILAARERADEALVRANAALERKTVELARSLALMRATLDSTTDGILVIDEAGHVTDCNDRFREQWRIAAVIDSLDYERIVALFGRQVDDPAAFRARLEDIGATAPPETFDTLGLADGRTFERFSKLLVVDGRNSGRVWNFRDVTQRRREEEESASSCSTASARRAPRRSG